MLANFQVQIAVLGLSAQMGHRSLPGPEHLEALNHPTSFSWLQRQKERAVLAHLALPSLTCFAPPILDAVRITLYRLAGFASIY